MTSTPPSSLPDMGSRFTSSAGDHEVREEESEDDEEEEEEESESEDEDEPNERDLAGPQLKLLELARNEVMSVRSKTQGLRKKLVKFRDWRDETDNSFMQLVRPLLIYDPEKVTVVPTAALKQRFDVMQSARTEYHNIEQELATAEIKLEEAEAALENLEKDFYRPMYTVLDPATEIRGMVDDDDLSVGSLPSRFSLRGIPAIRPADIHPQYVELMATVSKLRAAKELYEEYQADITNQLKQEETKELIDAHNPNDEELRKKSRKREYKADVKSQALVDVEIKRLEKRKEVLRGICEEKRLIPLHQPLNEMVDLDRLPPSDSGKTDVTLSIGTWLREKKKGSTEDLPILNHEQFANPQFPILLSNPTYLMDAEIPPTAKGALERSKSIPKSDKNRRQILAAAVKEVTIENLVSEAPASDKNSFINRWLLQRLRTSPLEADILYNVFEQERVILNPLRWQNDVLYWWTRDSGNLSKDDFQVRPSSFWSSMFVDPPEAGKHPDASVTNETAHHTIIAPEPPEPEVAAEEESPHVTAIPRRPAKEPKITWDRRSL